MTSTEAVVVIFSSISHFFIKMVCWPVYGRVLETDSTASGATCRSVAITKCTVARHL